MLAQRSAWLVLFNATVVAAAMVACTSSKAPAPAQSPMQSPSTSTSVADPSLAKTAEDEQRQRLEYLVREIEAVRESSHIPGVAVAVVRGDEVLMARGFGVRDLDSKEAVTADTIFAIGSSTKAMTATTLAMLVDEGKLSWDDPISKHLPELKLQIDAKRGEKATVRDLLSHRTGFPRMSLLWAGGTLSRNEILAFASKAKPTKPFRESFQYNNVQYMAAGEIAARVSKTSWANLIRTRLFAPLGMKTSHPTTSSATADKRRALGYTWWKTSKQFVAENHRNLDVIGPAGSVYSNVNEMTRWLRLQVGNGVFEGKRLVSEKALAETRRAQIQIGPGVSYGLGWMVREIDGHRVVEHGGNIDGYAAAVGFFPDDKIGFVMLSNVSSSALQGQMPQLIHDAMIGEGFRATGTTIDLKPYEGSFGADFGPFKGKQFTVKAKGNTLTLDVPGQMVFELKEPDENGKWYFKISSEIAASFEGPADKRNMLRLHQGGFDFELPREGSGFQVVVDANQAAPLLGSYREDGDPKKEINIVVYRGHLTLDVPGEVKLRLDNPGKDGRWQVRARKDFNVRFEPASGTPKALVWSRGGEDKRFVRKPSSGKRKKAATLASVLRLRKVEARKRALTRAGLIVATGVVNSPQTGLRGTITLQVDGSDQFRLDADFGRAGSITTVATKNSAWNKSSFDQPEQLEGVRQAQAQASHPFAVHGDWNDFYDTIKFAGTIDRDGVAVYRVELAAKGLPSSTVLVDSKTGDVIEFRGSTIEAVGEIPNVIRYEDFRNVGGVRLPFRMITEEFQSGESILQLKKVRTKRTRNASMFPAKLPR